MRRLALLAALASGAGLAAGEPPEAMDRAFNRIYNFDFAGAHAILEEAQQQDAADPMVYSVRAVAYLFTEYNRLQVLEFDFFADDETVTDRKRLKPDPDARARLFATTAEARKRAAARLARAPDDRLALFALAMAAGLETQYSIIIEKKYLRSYSLSKESQRYARRLLALDPPFYDAYVTLGSVEYVVANLNRFFRLFVRFDQIEGSRQKAVDEFTLVVQGGRYYAPYAKILLAVIHLREKRLENSLALLQELERDFPENPLFRNESRRLAARIARARPLPEAPR